MVIPRYIPVRYLDSNILYRYSNSIALHVWYSCTSTILVALTRTTEDILVQYETEGVRHGRTLKRLAFKLATASKKVDNVRSVKHLEV